VSLCYSRPSLILFAADGHRARGHFPSESHLDPVGRPDPPPVPGKDTA